MGSLGSSNSVAGFSFLMMRAKFLRVKKVIQRVQIEIVAFEGEWEGVEMFEKKKENSPSCECLLKCTID